MKRGNGGIVVRAPQLPVTRDTLICNPSRHISSSYVRLVRHSHATWKYGIGFSDCHDR